MSKLIFKIDNFLLSDCGINVETVSGLFQLPKRKTQISNDDVTSHGKFYDLTSLPKYTERTITLNCFINGTNRLDFINKVNAITSIFDGIGYHRLSLDLGNGTVLPYEVIRADGEPIEPDWNSSKTLAKFKITLVEPIPIKRVVIANGGDVIVKFHTEKLITIGWGDGTYTYDLYGDVSLTKNLTAGAQIVIMGDIEEITNFEITGGAKKWDIWS